MDKILISVLVPDLETLRQGGGPVIHTLRWGRGSLPNFFRPFGPQFSRKKGGRGPSPPGPLPQIHQRISGTFLLVGSVILKKFCLWDPESQKNLLVEFRVRNPTSDWNPESERSEIQQLKSGIQMARTQYLFRGYKESKCHLEQIVFSINSSCRYSTDSFYPGNWYCLYVLHGIGMLIIV